MTCPTCGGGAFTQIGLNYVTCAERRVAVILQQYPQPPKDVVYVCATSYQIGVAMDIPQCACGTHSALYGGLRLCESDHSQRHLRDNPAAKPLPGTSEERKAQREAQADLAALRARQNRNS